MSVPSNDPAFTAFVEVRARLDHLEQDLQKVQRRVLESMRTVERQNQAIRGTAREFDFVGVALRRLAPLLAASFGFSAIQRAVQFAEAIGDVADQLGLTTTEVQKFRIAFDQLGASQLDFDQTFSQFVRRLGEAREGSGDLLRFLEDQGIAFDAARQPLDVFLDTLERIGTLDLASASAASVDAFGRSGQKLIGIARQGRDAILAQAEAAERLGLVVGERTNDSLKELNDQFTALGQSTRRLISNFIELAGLDVATGFFTKLAAAAANGLEEIGRAFELLDRTAQEELSNVEFRLSRLQSAIEALKEAPFAGAARREAENRLRTEITDTLESSGALTPLIRFRLNRGELEEVADEAVRILQGRMEQLGPVVQQSRAAATATGGGATDRRRIQAEQVLNTLIAERLALENRTTEAIEARFAARRAEVQESLSGDAEEQALAELRTLEAIEKRLAVEQNERNILELRNQLTEDRLAAEGEEIELINQRARAEKEALDARVRSGELRISDETLKELKAQLDINSALEVQNRLRELANERAAKSAELARERAESEATGLDQQLAANRRQQEIAEAQDFLGSNRERLEQLRAEEIRIRQEIADKRLEIAIAAANEEARVELATKGKTAEEIEQIVIRQEEKISAARRDRAAEGGEIADDKVLQDLADAADTAAGRIKDTFETLDEKVADSFGEWLRTGENAFKSLGRAFTEEFAEVAIRELARVAIQMALLGGKAALGGIGALFGIPAFATGGIVTKPTFARVGEVPEAIIPLSRLGSMGGGGLNVQVINTTGQPARVEQSPGGGMNPDMLRILVGQSVVDDIERGGAVSRSIERRFGATRRGA